MKNLVKISLLLLTVFACNKEASEELLTNEIETVRVNFLRSGINIESVPLNGRISSHDQNTWIVIGIKPNSGDSRMGVFDPEYVGNNNLDTITLVLQKAEGLVYEFTATAVRKGTSGGLYYNDVSNSITLNEDLPGIEVLNSFELTPEGNIYFGLPQNSKYYLSNDSSQIVTNKFAPELDYYVANTPILMDTIDDGSIIPLNFFRAAYGFEIIIENNTDLDSITVSALSRNYISDSPYDSIYKIYSFDESRLDNIYDGGSSNWGSNLEIFQNDQLIYTSSITFRNLQKTRLEIRISPEETSPDGYGLDINILESPINPGDTIRVGG